MATDYRPDEDSDKSVCADSYNDSASAFSERSTGEFLREWATTYNIRHQALKLLINHLNRRLKTKLPKDHRTLLGTKSTTCAVERLAGGDRVIDIVQDVLVSDSLHRLHLGVMRRLHRAFVLGERYEGNA